MASETDPPLVFATLTPINQNAILAFSSLSSPQDANILSQHRQFVHFDAESTTLNEAIARFAPVSRDASLSPSQSSSVTSDATTISAKGGSDLNRRVHTGHYRFLLGIKLTYPKLGWRIGCGKHWKNSAKSDKGCDLPLADPAWLLTNPAALHSTQAIFSFDASGTFVVKTAHNDGNTTVGNVQLFQSNGALGLLRYETVIYFAHLQYKFAYTHFSPDAEAYFQERKKNYLVRELNREEPIPSISTTPLSSDRWIGRWRIASAVGRGTESFFEAAQTSTGQTATVKKYERRDKQTFQAVATAIASYERLRETLQGHDASRYLLRFLEVVYTSNREHYEQVPFRQDEAILFFDPLGRASFAKGITPSMAHDLKMTLFYQILQGLELLHRFGIVHADIKPENLCVASLEPGRVRAFIIDLGSVKWTVKPQDIWTNPGRGGTIGFLAPEQEASIGNKYGSEVDIFALGCVGYWMFCGDFIVPRTRGNPWRDDHPNPSQAAADRLDFLVRKRDLLKLPDEKRQVGHLLFSMLETDPSFRVTATEALQLDCWDALRSELSASEPDARKRRRRVD